MFRFENLVAFQYLLLIPVLLGIGFVTLKRSEERLKKSFGEKMLPFLTASISKSKRKWKIFLQSLVVAMMVLALARPQAGQSKQEVKAEGVEIMFLADVSTSMLADDVRPSRLEQMKTDLSRLLDLMPGNKVGIVAFAGSPALLSPLSTDPGALKLYIDSLSVTSVSSQGTEFKSALTEAKDAFQRGGVAKDDLTRVTRVIVVASDGEDHEQGALDQAKELVKDGTRIFTIAYGTEKGAPIPERDSLGYLRGYKKDKSGQTVLTTVHGAALRDLAQAGQGGFYHAVGSGDHLKALVEDINKLEKTEFQSEMAVQYDEKFQIFLVFAIFFLLLELFLGERRSAFRIWQGRFEVPPA
ncbi:MAG: BatB protein [Oligoflexia bacterium]|nr:MAG: BatB protein [Oligoflexia bacterium]